MLLYHGEIKSVSFKRSSILKHKQVVHDDGRLAEHSLPNRNVSLMLTIQANTSSYGPIFFIYLKITMSELGLKSLKKKFKYTIVNTNLGSFDVPSLVMGTTLTIVVPNQHG
jgi:hypothetical protein